MWFDPKPLYRRAAISLAVFLLIVGAVVLAVVRHAHNASTDRRAMVPSGAADLKLEPK